MEFTINQIALLLNGRIEGDGNVKIAKLDRIQDAEKGSISFLENTKYESYLYTTKASVVIVDSKFIPKEKVETTLLFVESPRISFSILLEEYYKIISFIKKGIEQPSYLGDNCSIGENIYRGAFSYIGNNVKIGKNVKIYPHVFIGDDVTIGDNTIFYPGVKIYNKIVVGNFCTFQANCVIGSDGFGFAPIADGSYKKILQVGNVIVEDYVDVGANTVIDCATMGSTIIKSGVKLDNLIQIAHNVEIGKHTVIAAQSGISGSTVIGDYGLIGGQVGIVGHIKIANKTSIGAQSGLSKSITKEGTSVQGSPAFDYMKNLKAIAIFKKLQDLLKRIEDLEQKNVNSPSL